MRPEHPVSGILAELARAGRAASMLVEQHARQVAGASSDRTVDTWETTTRMAARFAGDRRGIDATFFRDLYRHLEATELAVASKQTYYQNAVCLARGLMDRGRIEPFKIPGHYPHEQVRAATPPPPRLVDCLGEGVSGVDDGQLLARCVEWHYARLDRWRDLRALGRRLAAASADAFRATQVVLPRSQIKMDGGWADLFLDREEADLRRMGVPTERRFLTDLAYCLSYAGARFGGVPLTHVQFDALPGQGTPAARGYRNRLGRVGMAAPGLLTQMMVPGDEQAAVLAFLLAAAMVNVDSIWRMDRDCLRPGHEAGTSILSWSKPRAGGELPGTAFEDADGDHADDGADDGPTPFDRSRPVRNGGGKRGHWSLVAAIKDYREAAEPLRRRLPPGSADRLLLAQPRSAFEAVPELVTQTRLKRAVRRLTAKCAAELSKSDPRLRGLSFTLRAVRVSSIQHFHRSSGSLPATSHATKHRSAEVTARYVDTPELRASNTAKARGVQQGIVAAVRARVLVVMPEDAPAGMEPIGHGCGCRDRRASPIPGVPAGSLCEEFLRCFTCSNAVVVATPLNFALLSRFRDHLAAGDGCPGQTPEAFARRAGPGLEAAGRTLATFPPEVAEAGAALAPRLDIDFRVLW